MAINAAVAKLNTQALTKAVTRADGQNNALRGGGFKDVLNNMQSATDFAEKLGMSSGSVDPAGSVRTLSASEVSFNPAQDVTGVGDPAVSDKVVGMLSEVNQGQMQMDSMVNQILYSGKKFNPQELLAVQAHVYHYAQMAELTVKVAEHGVSSVKQVLNTQVQ